MHVHVCFLIYFKGICLLQRKRELSFWSLFWLAPDICVTTHCFSQAIRRELAQKWSSVRWQPDGMSAKLERVNPTVPHYWPQRRHIFDVFLIPGVMFDSWFSSLLWDADRL